MGCFDTVRLTCPSCRKPRDVQSKAGKCELKKYWLEAAPLPIVADLAEESERGVLLCPCGKKILIKVQFTVSVHEFRPGLGPDDDDDLDDDDDAFERAAEIEAQTMIQGKLRGAAVKSGEEGERRQR